MLRKSELVVAERDVAGELDRQHRSLDRLSQRSSSSDNVVAFLATYDSMMRIVEIALLTCGYRFGKHPHRAFKDLVGAVLGPETGVEEIVSVRHRTKKSGYRPSAESVAAVRALFANINTTLPGRSTQVGA